MGQEVLAWEGYFPNRPESCKEDITGMLARLGNAVPQPVELGYHLCYGTPNDEHAVMPTDLANAVEITHGILAALEPPLQYVHVPAPKHRDDDAYYAPLAALRLPEGCDLYLGVIHHHDRDGNRHRIAAATKTVSDFGIPIKCGWAAATRPPPPASSTTTASRWRDTEPRASPRDSTKTLAGKPGAVPTDLTPHCVTHHRERLDQRPHMDGRTPWTTFANTWPVSGKTKIAPKQNVIGRIL